MRRRWKPILFALSIAFALTSGSGLAATALAAPITHNEVSSPASPDNDPIQPTCNVLADGAPWKSPNGITYTCRYVSGVGWRWVPKEIPCQPAAQSAYAKETSATC
jgi:hypothetical protein